MRCDAKQDKREDCWVGVGGGTERDRAAESWGGGEEVQRERESERESWVEFQGAAAVKVTPEARRRGQWELGNRERLLEYCSQ